jgi:hypothetical protein
MSTNRKATMAKRQRESDQRERVKAREQRRNDRRSRIQDRVTEGGRPSGPPIEAATVEGGFNADGPRSIAELRAGRTAATAEEDAMDRIVDPDE